MARHLRGRGTDYQFIYAGRSRKVMPYVDDLVDEHGNRVHLHMDDEDGLLDIPGLVGACDPTTMLYMCGPKGLMDVVASEWRLKGLPGVNLRFETFGNSGNHPPEEFSVRIPRLGIETQVSPETTILDALLAAGADMMYDCLRGECGLCEVRVLDTTGVIDHRDVFLSEDQRRQGKTLCTCVTRVAALNGSAATLDIDVT
jgi:vanillate O-demethylase ferredoxin subunit